MSKGGSFDILKILVDGSYVSQDDANASREHAKKFDVSDVDYLVREGLVNDDIIGQANAEAFGVKFADVSSMDPSSELLGKIPAEVANKYRLVPIEIEGQHIKLVTDNPKKAGLRETASELLNGFEFDIYYGLSREIDEVLARYRKPLGTRFKKIIDSSTKIAPELVEEIIEDAVTHEASDIHFEPEQEKVNIRFRIDGALVEAGELPKQYYESVLNRIKVMANMRIDEHYSAQDGAIRYNLSNGDPINMRVSVAPLLDGEKIAIRVMSSYVRKFTLKELGMSAANQHNLETASRKPFGMILVTGPTGSGKTTTLYAALRHVSSPEINITTIEDPVEYRLPHVNQIQVNNATNLTFAEGLRSIARQDPDVILVGEIRDNETAEIAVNAALTGHLMLSTFHANDASTAIPRLVDMGIEPFLLASTLELIVAQRLVRSLEESTRFSTVLSRAEFDSKYPGLGGYFPGDNVTLYEGKTSDKHPSGFSGRTSVGEQIIVTQEVKDLILKSASSSEIYELARKQGMRTMFEDGIEKVKRGITSLDELLRVVPRPEEPDEK